MNKSLLSSLLIVLSACASNPSPYITSCDSPECERTAKTELLEREALDGVEVTIDSTFRLIASKAIQRIIHENDILILASENSSKIASTSLSLESFDLAESNLSSQDLLDKAFLTSFSALDRERFSPVEVHSIRAIKQEAMSDESARVYTQEGLRIYFYSETPSRHKAYVISKESPTSWAMLDFFDWPEKDAKKVLSTISLF